MFALQSCCQSGLARASGASRVNTELGLTRFRPAAPGGQPLSGFLVAQSAWIGSTRSATSLAACVSPRGEGKSSGA